MRPTHNSCIIIDSYKFNLAPTHTHMPRCGEGAHGGTRCCSDRERGKPGRGGEERRQAGRLILSFGSTCGPNHLSHLMDRQQVPLTMHPLPQAPLSLSLTYSTHLSLSLSVSPLSPSLHTYVTRPVALCKVHVTVERSAGLRAGVGVRVGAGYVVCCKRWRRSRSCRRSRCRCRCAAAAVPLPTCDSFGVASRQHQRLQRINIPSWPLLFIYTLTHTSIHSHTHSHKLLNNSCC